MAAVPHLHYSLVTDEHLFWENGSCSNKYYWPRPLQEFHGFGLLPLVRRFSIRVHGHNAHFTPKWLGVRTLRHFSALTNLQELGIDYLQVYRFMPNISHYFGHLAPTLRFLALAGAEGSSRQILYFIGLFPILQDLKLAHPIFKTKQGHRGDATLVPLSIPPLRGRLTLTTITEANFVTDMITLLGGLRFSYVELFAVMGTRQVLRTCGNTLDTLRLYPKDPVGTVFPFLLSG